MEIIINGASGWIGRSTLFASEKLLGLDSPNITCISSKRSTLKISGLSEFKTITLDEYFAFHNNSPDIYVHLPFKTKDYQARLSEEEYIRINRDLIKNGLKVVTDVRPKSVVIVSSGVVSRFKATNGLKDADLYTQLKIEEENLFSALCTELGINLVILRLWGASGSLMTEPRKYAIGDIVAQALEGSQIKISSDKLVYRRYVDAAEAMAVTMLSAIDGLFGVMDSGGTIVEMRELAERVLSALDLSRDLLRPQLIGAVPDIYFSTSTLFEEQAEKFALQISSLDSQIIQTRNALISSHMNGHIRDNGVLTEGTTSK